MNVFAVLLQKECSSLWKSKKIIWLPIVFMLLCAMQPITLYFMDDILKIGGSLPEGAIIQMPTPTAGEVMVGVLSQLNTMGVLLVIVTVMGVISDERKNGSLTMVLIRPVSTLQIVASKMVANGLLLIFSFFCGYLLSYYYTTVLFESLPVSLLIESFLLYSLYIMFIVSCVILSSSIFNSNGAIAIINAIFFTLLSLAGGWFQEQLQWSPTQLSYYASDLVSGREIQNGLWGSVILTCLLILVIQFLSAKILSNKKI